MLDDLRNHDAHPSKEELAWMDTDPFTGATRVLVFVGLSMMIGVTASFALVPDEIPGPVVSALVAPAR